MYYRKPESENVFCMITTELFFQLVHNYLKDGDTTTGVDELWPVARRRVYSSFFRSVLASESFAGCHFSRVAE